MIHGINISHSFQILFNIHIAYIESFFCIINTFEMRYHLIFVSIDVCFYLVINVYILKLYSKDNYNYIILVRLHDN